MKNKICIVALISLLTLSSCFKLNENHKTDEQIELLNKVIGNLRKGFTVSGQAKATTRKYANNNYQTLVSNFTPFDTKYDIEFTYQNGENVVTDRNIYLLDGDTRRMIIDDNVLNDNGVAKLRSLYYDNTIDTSIAYDPNDTTGMNDVSFGSGGFNNPFLSIDQGDITVLGENSYTIDNEKASIMMLQMLSSINASAFEMPVLRNIFNLDDSGNIKTLILYLDEYQYTTSGTNYNNEYFGDVYTITLNFSDVGTANAMDKLKPKQDKPENKPLRDIFDKMEASKNLKITRVDHTIYDGIEVPINETIRTYFDGEKIFYQVYEKNSVPADGPATVTDSDFLLLKDEKGLMVPHVRKADNPPESRWINNGSYGSLAGFEYNAFRPVIGDISEKLFDYDAQKDVYTLEESLAIYWTNDSCLISGIMVSGAIYGSYINKVEIKLKENGDIQYVRPYVYFDAGSYIEEGYYDITYEYGDGVKMPYNIDSEVKGLK